AGPRGEPGGVPPPRLERRGARRARPARRAGRASWPGRVLTGVPDSRERDGTSAVRAIPFWMRLLPAVAWGGLTWWLSSQSHPPGSGMIDLPFGDKLAHMALFGAQAALLRLAGLRLGHAVLFAVALGALDELHQAFVPRRQPDLADLAADAVGA